MFFSPLINLMVLLYYAQICLLIRAVSHVNDVAHGSLAL